MFGAVWAQAEVRKVLGATGARVLERDLPVAKAADAFDADGRLIDPEHREQLAEILAELVALAEQAQAPGLGRAPSPAAAAPRTGSPRRRPRRSATRSRP